MRKFLALMTILVAGAMAVPAAMGATGSVSQSMAMGTVNVDANSGVSFMINTPALVYATDSNGNEIPQESWFNNQLDTAQRQYPGASLDVWTIGCYQFTITLSPDQTVSEPYWKCASDDQGSATTFAASQSLGNTVTMDTTGLQECSWLDAYDPMASTFPCGYANVGDPYTDGDQSPSEPDFVLPNLDPYVGQTVTLNILTNWCSYIAPASTTPFVAQDNVGYGADTAMPDLGCSKVEYGSVTITPGAARMLAATSSNPQETKVKLAVQASPYDCHVPAIKGKTLKKVRSLLRESHCSVGHIRYTHKGRIGRVHYQTLSVGTGRPKGFPVKLVVGRK